MTIQANKPWLSQEEYESILKLPWVDKKYIIGADESMILNFTFYEANFRDIINGLWQNAIMRLGGIEADKYLIGTPLNEDEQLAIKRALALSIYESRLTNRGMEERLQNITISGGQSNTTQSTLTYKAPKEMIPHRAHLILESIGLPFKLIKLDAEIPVFPKTFYITRDEFDLEMTKKINALLSLEGNFVNQLSTLDFFVDQGFIRVKQGTASGIFGDGTPTDEQASTFENLIVPYNDKIVDNTDRLDVLEPKVEENTNDISTIKVEQTEQDGKIDANTALINGLENVGGTANAVLWNVAGDVQLTTTPLYLNPSIKSESTNILILEINEVDYTPLEAWKRITKEKKEFKLISNAQNDKKANVMVKKYSFKSKGNFNNQFQADFGVDGTSNITIKLEILNFDNGEILSGVDIVLDFGLLETIDNITRTLNVRNSVEEIKNYVFRIYTTGGSVILKNRGEENVIAILDGGSAGSIKSSQVVNDKSLEPTKGINPDLIKIDGKVDINSSDVGDEAIITNKNGAIGLKATNTDTSEDLRMAINKNEISFVDSTEGEILHYSKSQKTLTTPIVPTTDNSIVNKIWVDDLLGEKLDNRINQNCYILTQTSGSYSWYQYHTLKDGVDIVFLEIIGYAGGGFGTIYGKSGYKDDEDNSLIRRSTAQTMIDESKDDWLEINLTKSDDDSATFTEDIENFDQMFFVYGKSDAQPYWKNGGVVKNFANNDFFTQIGVLASGGLCLIKANLLQATGMFDLTTYIVPKLYVVLKTTTNKNKKGGNNGKRN